MAFATPRVAETMIGAMLLGRMWRKMISRVEVPVARAARMNSFSLSERNSRPDDARQVRPAGQADDQQ